MASALGARRAARATALLAALASASAALTATPAARAQAPAGSSAPASPPLGAAPGQFGGASPGQFPGAPASGAPAPPPPAGSPFGDMQAGGLTPPSTPATSATPPAEPGATSTDAYLDASKQEDDGRGLTWFWLEAGGGFEHVGLRTFETSDESLTGGLADTSGSGGVVDAGLGARLLFFTVGARGRLGLLPAWDLARLGGELGLRIPMGRVEPRFDAGGGFAALTGVEGPLGAEGGSASFTGWYARLGAGLDVFPVDALALGGGVSWEVLGLTRPGLPADEVTRAAAQGGAGDGTILSADGASVGSAVAITLRAGLHL